MQGDNTQYEAIFYHYHPRLYKYLIRFIKNHVWAEEMVMDVLYKVWQKRDTIRGADTFENYLFTIARNLLISEWRKKIETLLSLEEASTAPADPGYDPLLYKELEQVYQQSLTTLPEQRRRIFLLHRQENLSYKQIATQLDISPKTVENQVSSALKHLRAAMMRYLSSVIL
nr:RNA polymerase sigma-70 factor [Chitinophaga nivalis]